MKNICQRCNSFILRPTCALCLTDEIEAWLEKNNTLLIPAFKNHTINFIETLRNEDKQRCSFCQMDTKYITCLYCYTKYTYDWLDKTDKQTTKEFLEFFKEFLTKPKRVYA